MKDKLVILLVIVFFVALSGCIQSDLGKINDLSSKINTNLKNGDNYYNTAANNINDFSLDTAATNCDKAVSEFRLAKTSAEEGLQYAQNTNDQVFIDYMKYSVAEIDLRLNSTLQLKEAVPLLQIKDNSTGNSHVTLANQFMEESLIYTSKKEELVKDNPSKFKQ